METKTITLPEEFGSKKYVVKAFCSRKTRHDMAQSSVLTGISDMEKGERMEEIILTQSCIEPKITKESLNSDECNCAEMEYLALYLPSLYHLDLTEEKIDELKKKTQSQ